MERTEPTLIPEWLKNSSSTTVASSQSHSDEISASRVSKNKSSVHSNGQNFGRASGFERNASSSYFRRGSGGITSGNFRSYSSSGRNLRGKEWEKDKFSSSRDQEKSEDRRHWESSAAEATRFERGGLRRAQSMISGKHGDIWPKKAGADMTNPGGNNSDGSLNKGVTKILLEKDFPSLGTEERSLLPDIGRVPSPGLTTAIQSLPIGSSTALGEKWTSALAEVPILVGTNGSLLSSAPQLASSGTKTAVSRSTSGLNMAEAVTQGPIRAQTPPQLSVGVQRREELAIKQSRQLIPVTPSMPKTSALNSSDKSKGKALPVAPSPRASAMPGKTDLSKPSNPGKLLVLRSAREKNGLTSSPTASSVKVGGSAPVSAPSAPSGNHVTNNSSDRKSVLTVLEKRPTSQAQSRNEFFNSVRKKSLEITSSSAADSDFSCSLSAVESNDNAASSSPCSSDNNHSATRIDVLLPMADTVSSPPRMDGKKYCNGDAACNNPVMSEEEEAAFLRSMGWEDNDEEGGLTEEEISSFLMNLTKYVESNPSLRILQRAQLRFLSKENDAKLES